MSTPEGFIRALDRLGGYDELGKVAILRHSLATEPGRDVRAFPLVEPHVVGMFDRDRAMYYLVAGLWASVNTASVIAGRRRAGVAEEEEPDSAGAVPVEPAAPVLTAREGREQRSFGRAVGQLYLKRGKVESIERRFIVLLDADDEQLTHQLRQVVALLRAEEGISIDWAELLRDLLFWNHDERRVQMNWARAFYREITPTGETAAKGAAGGAARANTGGA